MPKRRPTPASLLRPRMTARQFVDAVVGELPQFAKPGSADPPKAQIRLAKNRQPNKTEARYKRDCESSGTWPTAVVWRYEALTFRLNSGTLYTPDWTLWDGARLVACVEVKGGHIRRDASKEKFKQACAEWPDIPFEFAQLTKEGWAYARRPPVKR